MHYATQFEEIYVWLGLGVFLTFYRAMHFSAKRGIAIALSSVCLSVCL